MKFKCSTSFVAFVLVLTWGMVLGQGTSDLQMEFLNGPVHVCIIEEVLSPKLPEKGSWESVGATKPTKILIYDPRGKYIEEGVFGEKGCLTQQSLKQYGNNQKEQRDMTRFFEHSKVKEQISTCIYDSKGRLKKIVTQTKGNKTLDSLVVSFGPDGTRTDYIPDDNGKLERAEVTHFNRLGKPVKKESYLHGILMQVTLISYNSCGLKASEEILVGREQCQARKTLYIYNDAGKLTKQIINPRNGKAQFTIEYSYDSSGNIKSVAYYNSDGKLLEWDQISCDSYGNWILLSKYHTRPRPKIKHQKPYEQLIRRIYYYCCYH